MQLQSKDIRTIEHLLEQKNSEYRQILAQEDIEIIKSFHILLINRRKKINSGELIGIEKQIDSLDDNTKRIFRLMKQYQNDIKQIFISNGESITHITDIAPDNMIGGKIAKSSNRENYYQTERGDWVFASSSPIDGSNPYIARDPQKGMIIIAKNAYIYGGNNMQIQEDEQGNKHVVLKKPNYVYEINPENFTPVVTLNLDETGKAYFEFSEEWISEEEIDINNPHQVIGIRKISDITDVVRVYQVFCDVNMTGEAIKIRSSGSVENSIRLLKESIRTGRLRYINGEAGINVNKAIEVKDCDSRDGR